MKYVLTFLAFVGFGLLVLVADFVEHASAETGEPYAVAWQKRLGMLDGNDESDAEGAARPSEVARGPKRFLPEAPAGWTRRAWVPDDGLRLKGSIGAEEERQAMQYFTGAGTVVRNVKGDDAVFNDMRQKFVWMYEQGPALVEMSAIPVLGAQTGMFSAPAMDAVANTMRQGEQGEAYMVVQGVPWTRQGRYRISMAQTRPEDQPEWVLTATVGDVALYLRTQALPEVVIRTFLESIDYDGLNASFDQPVDGIGSAAPLLPLGAEEASGNKTLGAERAKSAARTDAANESFARQGKALMAMADATPQGIAAARAKEQKFAEMGFPDRSLSGDMRVMGLDEIAARYEQLGDQDVQRFGMVRAELQVSLGLQGADMELAYDGLWPGAEADAARYAAGQMAQGEPGYAVREAEAVEGLPTGSCLQVRSGHVFCGILAERLRFSHANQRSNKDITWQEQRERLLNGTQSAAVSPASPEGTRAAPVQKAELDAPAAPVPRAEIKVNRFGQKGRVSASGCGGGSFCKVGGN
ncbi:hypothetical protein [Sagittula sp. S175]|uniref:hypothetical protein n=1 Tax=Sagittula sp. S175 TaxID=3415129 RepID=UPI003C7A9CB7